ncbi:F-box protein At5g03100-like [Euphorbia lathyris]|uniref:F-box protein At5g03100-like n=1 Tax=Euphorbia lathyris TaxID=212925 RepID=UPI003313F1F9
MAGTAGASMVESDGSCESQNGNKRFKSGEEEDRIGALPDFLIHRILSFLPATDLVRTLVLSKSWKYQWTHVPVLEFVPNLGMSPDKFSNFINKTLVLHNCSNIDKFIINLESFLPVDEFLNLDLWIRFAVIKDVNELIVNFNFRNHDFLNLLPQFLFNNSLLVKLKLYSCYFRPLEKVNWGSLKSLILYYCPVEDKAIENVVCGCPLLEHLELCGCFEFEGLVITSKSLKTLIFDGVCDECAAVEISCPNLERLRISDLVGFLSLKLMNLPSSVYATLDFHFDEDGDVCGISPDDFINLVQQTLRQVVHVEKLEIGRWLMEILLSCKEDGDCIAGLPDSLIHRIISYLPLTKDAFKTDLYKKWKHKWTDVPILNFVSNEKFVMDSKDIPLMDLDPRLSLWIRFATKKYVKELILDCDGPKVEFGHGYSLPQFLFNNPSLVKMKICACDFVPNGIVNWQSLKSLRLDHCEFGDQAVENVLSGSPLLECLELRRCGFQGAVLVASEHLKTFILEEFGKRSSLLEISCPNLESLKIWGNGVLHVLN